MSEEAERALERWRPGDRSTSTTGPGMWRCGSRCGPCSASTRIAPGVDVAATFERGLSFYEREYFLQVLRGPGSPFARLRRVRRTLDRIILGEIARRRRAGEPGEDLLGLLIGGRATRTARASTTGRFATRC